MISIGSSSRSTLDNNAAELSGVFFRPQTLTAPVACEKKPAADKSTAGLKGDVSGDEAPTARRRG